MKIELKNLKISLVHSEETTLFKADLYINGIKAGYCGNDGRGGNTNYNAYDGHRKLLEQAEIFCKTLPAITSIDFDFTYPMNLECFIDTIVNDEIEKKEAAKFNKKIQKAQETKIVFGILGKHFTAIGFTSNNKLIDVIKTEQGREAVKKLIASATKQMKPTDTILNTNIDIKGLQ